VLERRDLLAPLAASGFPLLDEYTKVLANADDLASVITSGALDAGLCQVLEMFLPDRR
jgi:hypothetical protein